MVEWVPFAAVRALTAETADALSAEAANALSAELWCLCVPRECMSVHVSEEKW